MTSDLWNVTCVLDPPATARRDELGGFWWRQKKQNNELSGDFKTRTGSITPDNVLKFCAFLSCVVVSSFIETRRYVFFFPEVITDSEAELWKIRCDELTSISELTACVTVFFFKHEKWQFFLLYSSPGNCTIAWFSNRKGMSLDERTVRRIVGILF